MCHGFSQARTFILFYFIFLFISLLFFINLCYAISRVLRMGSSDCLSNLTPGRLVYYSWRNLLLASLEYSAVNIEVAGSSVFSDIQSQCTQYCLLCIGVSFVFTDVFQCNPWSDAANLQNLPQTVKESI